MFDRYQIGAREQHITRTVTEHRAPTDESIRLLREMEEKARSQVIESFAVGGNALEARAVMMETVTGDTEIHVMFKLNGTLHRSSGRIDRSDLLLGRAKATGLLADLLTSAIGREVSLVLGTGRRDPGGAPGGTDADKGAT